MKIVSLKVAKAIKEAGYPLQRFHTVSREQFEHGWGPGIYSESPSILYPEDNDFVDMYFCPTYIDVWFWMWREKKIAIPVDYFGYENNYWESCVPIGNDKFEFFSNMKDPEEVIVAAIEYIADNNLIR